MTGAAFLVFSVLAGLVVERWIAFSERFWVRFSFATIVGTLLSTWCVFVLSYLVGFHLKTVVISVVCMAAYVLLNPRDILTLNSASFKISPAHAAIITAVMPLFIFGLRQTPDGGMTFLGNYQDVAYHMSMVSSFVSDMRFPPVNPQCAGETLRYHYLVNFHSAVLHMGGMSLYQSIMIPQLMFGFALISVLYHFYKVLLKDEGKVLFSAVFFIGGHIGVFNLIFAAAGFPASGTVFDITSWDSVKEQMLFNFLNFLNVTVNFFQPQRPFLFGFPLSLIILSVLYDVLVRHEEIDYRGLTAAAFLVGLLPLFHLHSFLVVCPFLCFAAFYLCPERMKTATALLPVLLGVIQIALLISGPKAADYSGFDVHTLGGGLREMTVLDSAVIARVLFWIRAAGGPLILGLVSAYIYFKNNRDFSYITGGKNIFLMAFTVVNISYFLIINIYRFTPNWGDSNKFFLYFALCMSIYMGELGWIIFDRGGIIAKAATAALIMAAGALPLAIDHYYIFFKKSPGVLYTACDKKAANWIIANTASDSVFLTDNGIVHFVAPLTGRAVVDGAYNRETGYGNPERQAAIRKIYSTGDFELITKYHVDYIVVSRSERGSYSVNDNALKGYDIVYDDTCQGDNYKIYNVQYKGG